VTTGKTFQVVHGLTDRQREIIMAGGLLNWTKQQGAAPTGKAKASKKEKVK
jgi:hypothetical protein